MSRFQFLSRDSCPACASTEVRLRYASRFDQPPIADFIRTYYRADPAGLDGSYRLDQCDRCRTIFQAEVGGDELLGTVYGSWIETDEDPASDPQYAFNIAHPRQSREGHELMAAAAFLRRPLEELTTLDFGMGYALWARVAAALGAKSHGFDLSPKRMAFAASHGILQDDADQTYDFINTEQVFEHLADPRAAAADLAARLNPNGILKISLPSPFGADRAVAELRRGRIDAQAIIPVQPLEHINTFTNEGLERLAGDHGLVRVDPFLSGFAFLKHRGTVDLRNAKQTMKELVRPFHQRWNPRNLYAWFQRAA